MKTSIVRLSLVAFITATGFIRPASSATVIDLGREIGPATHRASGLLWSVTADEPSDELIKPLKVQKYRCRLTPWRKGTGLTSFARMKKLGAQTDGIGSLIRMVLSS